MIFEIKIQYVYEITEWYTNKRYIVDNGWMGFCDVVTNLPKLQNEGCNIPCVLGVKRFVRANNAVDFAKGKKIDADEDIMNVPIKNWIKLAGFNKSERFNYNIVVSPDGDVPTVASLKKACPWQCGTGYCNKKCFEAREDTPAYYSNFVNVGVVLLDPERFICIAKDCKVLYPNSHKITPAGVSQRLKEFFDQPDSIQITAKRNDNCLSMNIYSCALREKEAKTR